MAAFETTDPALTPPMTTPQTGVIVTGGASGLGLASAEALAAIGRPVAIWDLDAEGARAAAMRIREVYRVPAAGLAVDVRDIASLPQAVEESRASLTRIGGLVHAAGVSEKGGAIEGFDVDWWDGGVNVHVRPIPVITRLILADLRRNPGSAVVAFASIQARMGAAGAPTYTACKGAVLSLVHSMADALATDRIRINSISPGMIRTPMLDRGYPEGSDARAATVARTMMGRLGEPAEIGRAVRFLMSDEASYVTGTDLIVDGGFLPSARRFPPSP